MVEAPRTIGGMVYRRVISAKDLARLAAWTTLVSASAHAETLTVGPGKTYAGPCAAVAAAHDNDVIEIDAAGDYGGDVCQIPKNGLTLRGVGGRAKIDAHGKNANGKAIWVISGHDTTVEDIELSGATVPDQNGAGIRQEGDNLTVRRCYFHDNDDGILSNASFTSQILIEYSEFGNNGFGDGYSHNLYIGNVARFTLQYSYSHDAKVGHLLKSRAAENYILYNRLSGEQGSSSYELDLPNAGTAVVLGNLIEQGPNTQNPTLLAYGEEGTADGNPGHDLHVVNNTFVNDRPDSGTFVSIGDAVDSAAQLQNNIFSGPGPLTNQAQAVLSTNFSDGDPRLVAPGGYDYTLEPNSPCIDQGTDPGTLGALSLIPAWQYQHPTSALMRVGVGAIDQGAYEFGAGNQAGAGASGAAPGAAGSSSASGAGDTRPAPSETERGCACRASRRGDARDLPLSLLVPLVSLFRARIRARRRRD